EAGPGAGIAYNRQGKARAGMGIATGVIDEGSYPSIAVGNFSRQPISLFTASPSGVFIDRAYASKIGKPSFLTLTFGLNLFDADLDGDLDLFAANGHVFTDIQKKVANIPFRQPPHLFLNDGSGVFADVADTLAGTFADSLVARASAYADIDGDGDLDLLIVENNGPPHLLRNNTGGRFLRVELKGERGNPNAIDAQLTLRTNLSRTLIRRVKSSDSYLAQSEFPVTFGLQEGEVPLELTVRWPVAEGHTTTHQDLVANGKYRIFENGSVENLESR
ncbi:MAG: FG-GAP-like repeat-containing protein, partial [Bacteroidota bacterium]